ncbi:hypothetical protein Hanom_Chr03g00269731 [Helianthus anomalus]
MQERPQRAMRIEVRYLLMVVQWPLLVRTGFRNWKVKTVPVGRSFMRFPTPESVLFLMVVAIFVMFWFGL